LKNDKSYRFKHFSSGDATRVSRAHACTLFGVRRTPRLGGVGINA